MYRGRLERIRLDWSRSSWPPLPSILNMREIPSAFLLPPPADDDRPPSKLSLFIPHPKSISIFPHSSMIYSSIHLISSSIPLSPERAPV